MILKGVTRYTDADSIFLYQMGKVGSSSMEASLKNTVHFHNLYNNPPNPPHLRLSYPLGPDRMKYILGLFLKRKLLSYRKDPIKIISPVRCPFERNVSMFFQALPFWLSEYFSGFGNKRKAHNNRQEGIEVLWHCFKENFNHEYPINWFEKEVGRFTGIDFYNQPFDKSVGFKIYRKSKFQVLVLSSKLINRSEGIISDFSGQGLEIKKINSGEAKWYANSYKDFKREFMGRYKDEFKWMKDTKYYRTFIDD